MIENEERYNFDKSLIDILHNILNKMPFDKYYNSLFVNKNILILLCNIIGILPIVYFIFIQSPYRNGTNGSFLLSIINQFSTLLNIITYTDVKQLISSKLQLLNTLQHPHTVSFFKPIDSIIEEKSNNHQSKPIFQQIIKPVEIKPVEIKPIETQPIEIQPLTDQLLTNNNINTTNDINNNIDKNIPNKRKINEEKTIDKNTSNKKTKIINNYDFESNKNIENDDSNDEDIPDIIV